MDRPARSFLSLLGLGSLLAAYSLCGFVALLALPLLGGAAGGIPVLCLLPAAALGGVLAIGSWRAGRSVRRDLASSHRLGKRIKADALEQPRSLRSAVEAGGLDGRVDLVNEEAAFSFVYGLLNPRIAISRGLLQLLSDRELSAVLAHERYHLRNLDPLRGMIAAAIGAGFFLLPALAVLGERYEMERELAADLCAEQDCGRRALLAALLKALEGARPRLAIAPSFADSALLEARVERLETRQRPSPPRPDLSTLAWSAYGIAAVASLFAAALAGLGGFSTLQQALAAELRASTQPAGLACLPPFFAIPALTLWSLRRRVRRPLNRGQRG